MNEHGSVGAQPGSVAGPVRLWLRLEGLLVLGVAVLVYARGDHPWLLFALLFFSPDLSLLGYLAGPRFGAAAYNALHSYAGALVLAVALILAGASTAVPLIWAAHIGFDRFVGYGLKYPTGFQHTHLGRIGRARPGTGAPGG